MSIYIRTRTDDVRALAGAIALGSGAGLVMGAVYLISHPRSTGEPVPVVSSQLQASAASPALSANLRAPAAAPATPRVSEMATALRDRFGLAGFAAKPFRFQQTADMTSDLHCLTEAVYFEARGEGSAGEQAVAQVVLNRVRHPAFPKTVCAVVHQRAASVCQFSFACGREDAADPVAWRRAQGIANEALHGAVMSAVGDATHFQAARSSPFTGLLKVAQVGEHIFYRFAGRAGGAGMFHQTTELPPPARVQVAQLDVSPPVEPRPSGSGVSPSVISSPAPLLTAVRLPNTGVVKPTVVSASAGIQAKSTDPHSIQTPSAGTPTALSRQLPVVAIALAQS